MKVRHVYPSTHWVELEKFLVGDTCDPKECFRLRDDVWDAWRYSKTTLTSERSKSRFHFDKLNSFIKPYVKSFCYRRLIESNRPVSQPAAHLPVSLQSADAYFRNYNFNSLDELSSSEVFSRFWHNELVTITDDEGQVLSVSNWRQKVTRPFWLDMSRRFGSPLYVPPTKYPKQLHPTIAAANQSKMIPVAVTRQLKNKLALHRDGLQRLNRFHHIRLCVLILMICAGRRADEVLTSSKGNGADGPLIRRPYAGGAPEDALWFSFRPNKGGPRDEVYISPEWEELTIYCVREVLRYSDEVRHLAEPEDQGLLILISGWNWTSGGQAKKSSITEESIDFNAHVPSGNQRLPQDQHRRQRAIALRYQAMCMWLYGQFEPQQGLKFYPGVLETWNITEDGSADGKIYRLRLLQARHTRQTALSSDPSIPRLTLQRDINHREGVSQIAYQHNLEQQHGILKAKVRGGELVGNGVKWLQRILGVNVTAESPVPDFKPGTPSIFDDRWRKLIEDNPLFIQFNRVPCGYCTLPQSPLACREYMNCTEAEEGGCRYFLTDPKDKKMLSELKERAGMHRQRQRESLVKGYTVQAGRHEVCADRTEDLRERALVSIERLKRIADRTSPKHAPAPHEER